LTFKTAILASLNVRAGATQVNGRPAALRLRRLPSSLLLKLLVTPSLIAAATLVGRRWGPALSGWLVGLPLTSAPVVFFLALENGTSFATAAALGVVLGVASQAVFAVAYSRVVSRAGWLTGVAAGSAGFAAATLVFQAVRFPAAAELVLVVASLLVAIAIIRRPLLASVVGRVQRGDLPLRMVVATALVVGLTAIAPQLGPHLTGLLSPFPVYAAILAVFAHRLGGAPAAVAVWRGLLFGLFSFAAFFTVLAGTLPRIGIPVAFALAIAVALAVQGIALLLLRAESSVTG
jgi:hypothetical protein